MKSKAKYFSRKIGLVMNALGMIQVIPLLMSLLMNEARSITFGYVFSAVLTFVLGLIFIKFGNNSAFKPDKWSGLVLAALVTLFLLLPASLPYLLILKLELFQAVFETTSGLTTTGLTVLKDLSQIPDSLLMYRALTQWFGGAIFLAFFVLVGFRSEDQFLLGYSNTINMLKLPRPISSLHKGVLVFIFLYIIFTIVEIIWYLLMGVPAFESFAHSFTTVSSGGFSTFDNGFINGMGFSGIKEKLLIFSYSSFMLLSGIGYFLYVKAVSLDFKTVYKNNELRIYLMLIVLTTLIILGLSSINQPIQNTSFEDSLLFVIGSLSSVGIYQTSIYLSTEIVFVLLVLIAIGGMIGSTSGGLKINRVRVVIRSVKYEADHIFKPSQVVSTLKLDGKSVDGKVVLKLITLIFAWFIIALGSWLLISIATELDGSDVTKSVISALANGGFIDSGWIDFGKMNPFALFIYTCIMIVGRLEIYPILVLFHLKAWKY